MHSFDDIFAGPDCHAGAVTERLASKFLAAGKVACTARAMPARETRSLRPALREPRAPNVGLCKQDSASLALTCGDLPEEDIAVITELCGDTRYAPWAQPLSTVCKHYGLFGNEIKRFGQTMNVPVLGRAYGTPPNSTRQPPS